MRRVIFPLSAATYAPSPSHCDGWLQICFMRMSAARIAPRLSMPSAAESFASRSRTAASYSVACVLVSGQNARTSVLSGRSEMTLLSVFSRRSTYGRTSARSGAYALCSRLASALDARPNSAAEPRSPGMRKSKSDHKSPRRFSMGVPVNARRARARSFLTARVCLAPGFLIACASSSTTSSTVAPRSTAPARARRTS